MLKDDKTRYQKTKLLLKIQRRNELKKMIQEYFYTKKYFEIDSPILTAFPSCEPLLEPLKSEILDISTKEKKAWLRPSFEIHLKKIISQGILPLFELGPVFRNRENLKSPFHEIEFYLLEWYQKGKSLQSLVKTFEDLIKYIQTKINKRTSSLFPKLKEIKPEIKKLSLIELFKKYYQLNKNDFFNQKKLKNISRSLGLHLGNKKISTTDYFYFLYSHLTENYLKENTFYFIDHFPNYAGAFAKPLAQQRHFSGRGELFFGKLEIGNGYTEIDNPQLQKQRMIQHLKINLKEGYCVNDSSYIDKDFIQSIKKLKNIVGMAIGFERLLMILSKKEQIKNVILYPTSKVFK